MAKVTARWAAIPVLLTAILLIAAQAEADSEPLTVMTYNVYLAETRAPCCPHPGRKFH